MPLSTAIVGYGVVGRAMHKLLPESKLYDVVDIDGVEISDRRTINQCDIAFVCVPTPESADGTCDTSYVEEAVAWLETPLIVLRSTVPPGTTDALSARYDRHIVFQPEYLGETAAHPFEDMTRRQFLVLGGTPDDVARVADVYNKVHYSDVQYFFTDAKTAEVAKYMENCFYAAKVTFCNEFFGLARALGVEYNELREMWLADPRISRDHTFVYPDKRGFDGKCLPKDLAAMISSGEAAGYEPQFLRAIREVNEAFKAASDTESPVRLVPRKQAADVAEEVS